MGKKGFRNAIAALTIRKGFRGPLYYIYQEPQSRLHDCTAGRRKKRQAFFQSRRNTFLLEAEDLFIKAACSRSPTRDSFSTNTQKMFNLRGFQACGEHIQLTYLCVRAPVSRADSLLFIHPALSHFRFPDYPNQLTE